MSSTQKELEILDTNLEESIEVKRKFLEENKDNLLLAAAFCRNALKVMGTKLIIAGNGGSATDASHFSGELVGRFQKERDGLACIFLGGDISAMTAIANDYGYEEVFARQLKAIMRAGDIFIAISTSGNSKNILKAVEVAKAAGRIVISLTGGEGGKLAKEATVSLNVSGTKKTARIQETHIWALHNLAELIESVE